MKVILTKDVAKLGRRYDVKEVKSGYALNLLIPRGDAVVATPEALKRVEVQRSRMDATNKINQDLLEKSLKSLESVVLKISGKANEKGHLFAGLHREAVAAELAKQTKLQFDPSFIQIETPIKATGEHTIEVKAGDKSAKFKLVISAS